jgi:5-methylcytosine-specific restriction endonuclease McrA
MPKKPKQYKPKKAKNDKVFRPGGRLSARQKGYDSAWERYRRRFLYYNTTCYACGLKATVVDHVQVHRGDTELFKSLSNHIPLCKTCHAYVTGRFDRHEVQKLEEKLEWLAEQRRRFGITQKVYVMKYYNKKANRQ